MLNDPYIGWYGKLPSSLEFIQSNYHPQIEQYFKQWFTQGQNHLGESLIRSSIINHYFIYFFQLTNHLSSPPIQGIIFSSHDQRGRLCPFVLFSLSLYNSKELIHQFRDILLNKLSFNLANFFSHLNEDILWQSIAQQIEQYQLILTEQPTQQNYWSELLVQDTLALKLQVEHNTPITYRKLFIREERISL